MTGHMFGEHSLPILRKGDANLVVGTYIILGGMSAAAVSEMKAPGLVLSMVDMIAPSR